MKSSCLLLAKIELILQKLLAPHPAKSVAKYISPPPPPQKKKKNCVAFPRHREWRVGSNTSHLQSGSTKNTDNVICIWKIISGDVMVIKIRNWVLFAQPCWSVEKYRVAVLWTLYCHKLISEIWVQRRRIPFDSLLFTVRLVSNYIGIPKILYCCRRRLAQVLLESSCTAEKFIFELKLDCWIWWS